MSESVNNVFNSAMWALSIAEVVRISSSSCGLLTKTCIVVAFVMQTVLNVTNSCSSSDSCKACTEPVMKTSSSDKNNFDLGFQDNFDAAVRFCIEEFIRLCGLVQWQDVGNNIARVHFSICDKLVYVGHVMNYGGLS